MRCSMMYYRLFLQHSWDVPWSILDFVLYVHEISHGVFWVILHRIHRMLHNILFISIQYPWDDILYCILVIRIVFMACFFLTTTHIYYIKIAAILQRGLQKKTWLHRSPAAGWGGSNVEGDGGDKAAGGGSQGASNGLLYIGIRKAVKLRYLVPCLAFARLRIDGAVRVPEKFDVVSLDSTGSWIPESLKIQKKEVGVVYTSRGFTVAPKTHRAIDRSNADELIRNIIIIVWKWKGKESTGYIWKLGLRTSCGREITCNARERLGTSSPDRCREACLCGNVDATPVCRLRTSPPHSPILARLYWSTYHWRLKSQTGSKTEGVRECVTWNRSMRRTRWQGAD